MKRLMMLAPVLALAVSGAYCAGDSNGASPTSPSSLVTDSTTAARGGGGKPSGGGGGTLAWVMVIDKNSDLNPNWGDTVTFNVSTTATAEPTVSLVCSQNGNQVYGATSGFYDSYPWPWTKNMALWSGAWTSGAADCTATLFPNGDRRTVLATVSFKAGA